MCRSSDPRDKRSRVGALVAMMLGLGYMIGAISPFVLGAVRDATGSFTAGLLLIAGLAIIAMVIVLALGHNLSLIHISEPTRP